MTKRSLHALNARVSDGNKKPLPAAFTERIWRPGVSGNPGGRTVAYAECQRLAREVSVESTERLIEIMRQRNDLRAAIVASEALYRRAWGSEPEKNAPKNPLEDMTPEQRRKRLLELLAYAETLQVPEDARIDEAEPVNGTGATLSATERVSVTDSVPGLCEHGRPRNEFCQGCAWMR
jgi:hypothetical protein